MEEKKVVKVKLRRGSVFTIKVSEQTDEFIEGTDKYGQFVRIGMDEIVSLIPISDCPGQW